VSAFCLHWLRALQRLYGSAREVDAPAVAARRGDLDRPLTCPQRDASAAQCISTPEKAESLVSSCLRSRLPALPGVCCSLCRLLVEILPSGGHHVSFPALQTRLASSNVRTSLMDSSMWTRAARGHVTCAPWAKPRSNAFESPIQRGGIEIRPYAATPTVSRPSPLLVSSHLARTQVATILGTRKHEA
jgi:hypothetical protein